jgi:hypothetical protein
MRSFFTRATVLESSKVCHSTSGSRIRISIAMSTPVGTTTATTAATTTITAWTFVLMMLINMPQTEPYRLLTPYHHHQYHRHHRHQRPDTNGINMLRYQHPIPTRWYYDGRLSMISTSIESSITTTRNSTAVTSTIVYLPPTRMSTSLPTTTASSPSSSSSRPKVFVPGPSKESCPDYSTIYGPLGQYVDYWFVRIFRDALAHQVSLAMHRQNTTTTTTTTTAAPMMLPTINYQTATALDIYNNMIEYSHVLNRYVPFTSAIHYYAQQTLVSLFPSWLLPQYRRLFSQPFPAVWCGKCSACFTFYFLAYFCLSLLVNRCVVVTCFLHCASFHSFLLHKTTNNNHTVFRTYECLGHEMDGYMVNGRMYD